MGRRLDASWCFLSWMSCSVVLPLKELVRNPTRCHPWTLSWRQSCDVSSKLGRSPVCNVELRAIQYGSPLRSDGKIDSITSGSFPFTSRKRTSHIQKAMVSGEFLGSLLIGYWLSHCLARLHAGCTVKMRWRQHISSRARKLRSAETSLRTCFRVKRREVSEAKEVGLPV